MSRALAIVVALLLGGIVLTAGGVSTGAQPLIQPTPEPCNDAWIQIDTDDEKSGNSFEGIAGRSADIAFAAGHASRRNGTPDPLIKRWNGKRWDREPVKGTFYLHDIGTGHPGPLWAVGEYSSGSTLFPVALKRTAAGNWKRHDPARPSSSLTAINDVSVLSKRHAWASGTYWDGSGQHRALIQHWNGRKWSVAPVSNIGLLDDVFARARDDVWAVGRTVRNGQAVTLTLRFNGKRWRHVSSPNQTNQAHYLYGVAAAGRRNAWAVGERSGDGKNIPLLMRWNGERWRFTDPGLGNREEATARAVSVYGDEVVVVGEFDPYARSPEALIMTWDGDSWTRENTERFEESIILQDVEHAPNGAIYAAGNRSTRGGSETVYFRPPLCP